MLKQFLPFILVLLVPIPAIAQVSATSSSTPNQSSASAGAIQGAQVVNESETSNQSSVGGTVNNVGNNVSPLALPSYTGIRDLRCESSSLDMSIFGSSALGNFSGGGIVSLRMPLGNQASRNCNLLSEVYLNQAQYDTYINLTNFCVLAKEQEFNLSQAPEGIRETCLGLGLDI
jgi:hypothetical protein